MFHILANLDQEERWLGTTLPEHIHRRLGVMATLLQALATEDDDVTVHVGAPLHEPVTSDLWRPPAVDHRPPPRVDLWWCDPAAKPFNDRRFSLALAKQLGCALPRAEALTSLEAIDAHLAAGSGGAWVLKAPWSSAGRHRVFSAGFALEGEHRVAAERLLARTGALVFEPWCERICDVAVCGVAGVEVTEPHEILNGPRGNFCGIELEPAVLEVGEHDQLVTTAERVAQHLADAGYRGPFGIDAFVHRVGTERVLHPLCEINARHTFGHVARALGRRFGGSRLEFAHPQSPRPHLRLVAAAHAIKAWVG